MEEFSKFYPQNRFTIQHLMRQKQKFEKEIQEERYIAVVEQLDGNALLDFLIFGKCLLKSEVKDKQSMAIQDFSRKFPGIELSKDEVFELIQNSSLITEMINSKLARPAPSLSETNILEEDFKTAMKFLDIGNKMSELPIFKECCHNCGFLFF